MPEEKNYPNIIAFDVETTGLYYNQHKITEIGSIKCTYNGKIIDSFSKFGNPGKPLEPKITELTGITDEMLRDAPPSDDVIKEWMAWVEPGSILLAHNASFDIGFVSYPFIKEELDFEDFFVIDTLEWSRKCFRNLSKHKLGVLLEHINYPIENLHRAEDDARGALFLASRMAKQMYQPTNPDDLFRAFKNHGKPLKQYLPKKFQPSTNFSF